MAVKKAKRNKRYMSSEEVRLRKMMVQHQVTGRMIANKLDIHEPQVTYTLRSLTPEKVDQLEDVILELSNKPQKVAS